MNNFAVTFVESHVCNYWIKHHCVCVCVFYFLKIF